MSNVELLANGQIRILFPQNGTSIIVPGESFNVSPNYDHWHHYNSSATVQVDPLEEWIWGDIELEDVQLALLQQSAPEWRDFWPFGQNTDTPPQVTGGYTNTPDFPWSESDTGVFHIVSDDGKVIVNMTEPGHPFHPGYVVRTVVENADGSFSILSAGIGNTDNESFIGQVTAPAINTLFGDVLFSISSNLENQARVNAIARQGDHCFLAGTMISMWPLDVQPDANGLYNEKEVLSKVWKKSIEEVTANDWVLSFDKNNNLQPGKVTRTFQNEAKIILDFHGTFVTPGHVYYREDSQKANKFEPLIDILRDDGIIRHQDGTLIRATTGCEVGSKDDEQFWAFTIDQVDGGERVRDKKQLRLGTRWMLPNGQHFSMREYMEGIGVELIEEGEFKGYVRHKKNGLITIFAWVLSDILPNPEDFVLQRSQTSLEEIYRAGEWESMRPHMPAPMVMDGGPVQALGNNDYEQMPRNMPMAFKNETPSSALLPSRQNQPTMNRQQRRAMERKQRKAERSQGQTVH